MYRVWCNNRKEWEKDTIAILPNGNILHIDTHRSFPCMVKKETHPIEFFTGLEDRKKQKVFDGDIVRQGNDICIIRSCVGGYECKIIGGANTGCTFVFAFLNNNYCEVIGNIHENPELLGGAKI